MDEVKENAGGLPCLVHISPDKWCMCGLWHIDEIEQVICTPSKRRYCGKYITTFFYVKIITLLEQARASRRKHGEKWKIWGSQTYNLNAFDIVNFAAFINNIGIFHADNANLLSIPFV